MSSNDTTEGGQPLVFGVPSGTVAAALRSAGLDENAVVAVLGRAIARSAGVTPGIAPDVAAGVTPGIAPDVGAGVAPGVAPGAGIPGPGIPGPILNPGVGIGILLGQGFTFQVNIAETAPECTLSYQRLFVHPDFIDGVTVVQAGQTPDEIGFNARFHSIEAEFDSIARNLQTSSNCVAELRRELYQLARELEAKITDIDARIAAKGKDKDTKEGKESKEGKEGKETKEKDTKEGKDKEGKDHKDGKDKEHIDKIAAGLEKISQIEGVMLRGASADIPAAGPAEAGPGTGRTFITLDDRPDVEAAALRDDVTPPAAPGAPATPATAPAAPATPATPATAPATPATPAAAPAAPETAAAAPAAAPTPAKSTPAKSTPAKATPAKTAGGASTGAGPRRSGTAAKKTAGTAAKTTGTATTKATGTAAKKAAPRRRGSGGSTGG